MSSLLPLTDVCSLMAYAAAMSVTPGPNNAMLATLGARHGWRGALPYAGGVVVGMAGLMVLAGLGVGAMVAAAPGMRLALTALGVGYMAWLAWALWWADAPRDSDRPPVGFWGGVAFQAVNPKALLMAITAASGFVLPGTGLGGALALAVVFVSVGGPCIAVWALAGDRLRDWLRGPGRAQVFSRSMAVLVALTAVSMVLEA